MNMKSGAFSAASVLILIAVFRTSFSQETCLLNRLDNTPCSYRNPSSTAVPANNEQGIYSTRIKGPSLADLSCRIRRRNHQIRAIQTVGGDPRLLFLYSPGFELADPEKYGNQMIVFYNISCPANHIGVFSITEINMEEPTCLDSSAGQMKCVDFVLVRDLDNDDFGLSESCGTDPGDNQRRLTSGKIGVTFRTSDSSRFPGFKATVTCVDPNTDNSGNKRRKRTTAAAENFEAELQRQIDYITRTTRYYKQVGYYERYLQWFPFLFRSEAIIIRFGESFLYSDNKITIQQGNSSRNLASSVLTLKVLNANEEVTVFRRSAKDEEWNLIPLTGPGTLSVVGCSAFYRQFIISPRGILQLTEEQNELFLALSTSPFNSVLETPEQKLCDEIVDPPSFDLDSFSIDDPIDDDNTSIPECPQPTTAVPIFCNYTDDLLRLSLENADSPSVLLRTIVDVVLSCTKRLMPGRLENLTVTIPELDVSCSISFQDMDLSVTCSANREEVVVRNCSVVGESGSSVSLDQYCKFPSFEFPMIGSGVSPGRQTLILELVASDGSSTTEQVEFFIPLFVQCFAQFNLSSVVSIACVSNQERLTVSQCRLDGRTPLTQCAYPDFELSTRGLSPGRHSVTISFEDDELRSSTLTVQFTVFESTG